MITAAVLNASRESVPPAARCRRSRSSDPCCDKKVRPGRHFGSTRHSTVAVLSEAYFAKRASQRLEDARPSTECRAEDYFVSEDVLHALVALFDFA